ncbi:MAG: aminopeptidase N [Mesorhizobium sp.]|uniref:aminopeptidase N n=3 Tax=Mesorhizobium TaxID=68287 RepID=UPI000F7649C6|nr:MULTISPECIES: aminopeptidase N [unclassified Mesorhizobium]RUY04770.1 aminopeptidase N [Mesorhizobium sp. M2A.F.Ca.ET.040.01.1.1]AZO33438.1 aminopeptidase N [Mesorhizobium sp. M2A.F.Ca.ET.046.03.2.1]RWA89092.1 MAG: aminopeptidase N [Mesorhizobium sp.]RWB42648.1 MAG: aminopeptidase N [Mesorhizobium sp.]RWE89802.1 MAG: aminopeptidase N [Mesorhizobium sp.]
MRTDTGHVFKLEDYRPSDYLIPRTGLDFRLSPDATHVTALLTIERREGVAPAAPLVLDGDGLTLLGLAIDGQALAAGDYEATPDRLTILKLPAAQRFELRLETEIAPSRNEALMGLYRSNNVYCTQCEAEGFRRITYFLDRPDILSVYTVRIEAPHNEAPLLLSNGNPVERGALANGRHYAVWHDPFPKPSYLFALVAGALGRVAGSFTTMSGREVELGIYVEPGKERLAGYAMDALKRSMKWDEDAFGREYDLDVFNIVAVSDFNMGAMENKGLNVFNDKYVLADEETATDADFANIEAIIAHEYFHNWTGNRITCRDWFQLCLKEGLTVYRDHEYSADQRSRAVKRIAEVRTLRAHQFPEDQGPLAHPVRPRRYREINNFYTATVYEKGSEVVRMIRTILGPELFRAGMDLYFERHDGEAATIEDFLKVFEDVSGRDLAQFALWYHQAGTPNLTVSSTHNAAAREFTLEIEQSVPPTPSESRKRLMHIPLAFGLVGAGGQPVTWTAVEGATVDDGVIHIRKRRHTVRFSGVSERPSVSLNRGFSAPITLSVQQKADDQFFLAAHDSDPFARWQAFNTLLTDALIAAFRQILGGKEPAFAGRLAELAGRIAGDEALEPAYRALALTLPGEADIARDIGKGINPDAIFAAREALARAIAGTNRDAFSALYDSLADKGPFSPDAASAGRRALRNILLDYLSLLPGGGALAARHFNSATNMTDRAAALAVLAHRHSDTAEAEEALAAFEGRYRGDALVLDKWFQIQAGVPGAKTVDKVRALMLHPAFSIANPNRVRSLIGTFSSANQTGFHRPDGEGYRLFAETVLEVEKRNPQVAARLATALRSWRSLEPGRQAKAKQALLDMAKVENLSADLRDIVERTLA